MISGDDQAKSAESSAAAGVPDSHFDVLSQSAIRLFKIKEDRWKKMLTNQTYRLVIANNLS